MHIASTSDSLTIPILLSICFGLINCTGDSKTLQLKTDERTSIKTPVLKEETTTFQVKQTTEPTTPSESKSPKTPLNPNALQSRITTPNGYQRTKVSAASFGHYLRNVTLKPEGSKVQYYNGSTKEADGVYMAVIDGDIGDENLHQCADAIMRLKADYHYQAKDYDKIHFNLTNGHQINYTEWRKGRRIKLKGNNTSWDNGKKASTSYEDYWDYLELIFMYAGTASLSKELKSVPYKEMQIGDVLIKGGFPGHGVIVIDMAIDPKTREKIYLLAQSYMPAQETQILINISQPNLSPWYKLDDYPVIVTPEYQFDNTDLMRFVD